MYHTHVLDHMTSAMESHHPVRPKPMNHEFFCTIVIGLTCASLVLLAPNTFSFLWCISSKKCIALQQFSQWVLGLKLTVKDKIPRVYPY